MLFPVGGRGLDEVNVNAARHPADGGVMNRSPAARLPATGCAAMRVAARWLTESVGWSLPGCGPFWASGTALPNSRAMTAKGFSVGLKLSDADIDSRYGLKRAVSLSVLPSNNE